MRRAAVSREGHSGVGSSRFRNRNSPRMLQLRAANQARARRARPHSDRSANEGTTASMASFLPSVLLAFLLVAIADGLAPAQPSPAPAPTTPPAATPDAAPAPAASPAPAPPPAALPP